MLKNLLLPFCSRNDITIEPVIDQILVSKVAQVRCHFIAESSIFVSIGDEHIVGHVTLPFEKNGIAMTIIQVNLFNCHLVNDAKSRAGLW
jgi:hypothetical protein